MLRILASSGITLSLLGLSLLGVGGMASSPARAELELSFPADAPKTDETEVLKKSSLAVKCIRHLARNPNEQLALDLYLELASQEALSVWSYFVFPGFKLASESNQIIRTEIPGSLVKRIKESGWVPAGYPAHWRKHYENFPQQLAFMDQAMGFFSLQSPKERLLFRLNRGLERQLQERGIVSMPQPRSEYVSQKATREVLDRLDVRIEISFSKELQFHGITASSYPQWRRHISNPQTRKILDFELLKTKQGKPAVQKFKDFGLPASFGLYDLSELAARIGRTESARPVDFNPSKAPKERTLADELHAYVKSKSEWSLMLWPSEALPSPHTSSLAAALRSAGWTQANYAEWRQNLTGGSVAVKEMDEWIGFLAENDTRKKLLRRLLSALRRQVREGRTPSLPRATLQSTLSALKDARDPDYEARLAENAMRASLARFDLMSSLLPEWVDELGDRDLADYLIWSVKFTPRERESVREFFQLLQSDPEAYPDGTF